MNGLLDRAFVVDELFLGRGALEQERLRSYHICTPQTYVKKFRKFDQTFKFLNHLRNFLQGQSLKQFLKGQSLDQF